MKANQQSKITLNENIPNHVAIIMDGNGRWAQRRFMPRVAGHKRGMEVVKTITKAASSLGVKVLTLYAFSTENWKRPQDEVSFLMKLPITFFDTFVPELIEQGVRVKVTGNIEGLPQATQDAVNRAIGDTAHGTKMILNFALNYGSRDELAQMTRSIAQQVANGEIVPEAIDEQLIARNLQTSFLGDLADPDLLIRTSGEERISNFLLWQIAYSELIFTDTLWPDFNEQTFMEMIKEYQKRDRRFGAIKK
ncbi:Ditrans,polycis-undecaprenyl-diphosphate synthase ((2E,6E)-farnesyl-diphosphate specific) [Pediococcus acidilactici]|uniref:isoprenyl transferase n=1 Tax=Pediococcus acidilactici TaxID=1254 RepID=UPI0007EFA669|nr:isoprenyl transferase [Pediococcus acidilactici]ARW24334.1 Ditrans,polycis-undecaprenyl-diphosphate synthase ((2E,6E)-farnesyl-diphosphate specific) [Pediococcus acidilactici]ARW26368.1 Ditrans,polycis-undecaprenyl-diphosphate synthase ((2E,6E)-farnesyl-diphosphate specific) [Pediococcus acidilactici]ARW28452.1 Ditrans,polycis-undecaprenyl-diphosphate synthase ((2E,6E)-farnesyl-diphosphate specific) [Pediococcus acidilactici]OBR26011.1 Ditrans,polycis-undecaprenyl-diphosphate synthase ((2E,6